MLQTGVDCFEFRPPLVYRLSIVVHFHINRQYKDRHLIESPDPVVDPDKQS